MAVCMIHTLDHVVVNARERMDEAAEIYRRLGFTLTPRGHHTLGSINHLAMFGSDYLELIGVPDLASGRRSILDYPFGVNGLVFGTEDANAVHATLAAAGVPVEAPQDFSRPVDLPEGSRDARFRTVRMPNGTVEAGRVYFCQHFTRDLVWREEWQHHANGAVAVAGATITCADPAALAALFARMFGAEALQPIAGGHRLAVGLASFDMIDRAATRARFGDAAPEAAGDRMTALTFRTTSLARAAACAGVAPGENRVLVPADQAMGAVIEFVA